MTSHSKKEKSGRKDGNGMYKYLRFHWVEYKRSWACAQVFALKTIHSYVARFQYWVQVVLKKYKMILMINIYIGNVNWFSYLHTLDTGIFQNHNLHFSLSKRNFRYEDASTFNKINAWSGFSFWLMRLNSFSMMCFNA